MRFYYFVFLSLFLLTVVAPAGAVSDEPWNMPLKRFHLPWTDVRQYGAKGNGRHDDTRAFRNAVADLSDGAILFVPQGEFLLTDTIVINKAISVIGTGVGSQILQQATDKTLLQFTNVNAVSIKDLYLGSAALQPANALLQLTNSHHNRIENVTMLGGYYGLHLEGSLLNTVIDLRSGTNFGGFFAATSANQYWVFAERFNSISSNANTFVAPVLEGGVNGLWLVDQGGEGSLTITGGTIEGVSGTALQLERTFLPSAITGVHFEANGVADLVLQDSSNVRVSAILSLKQINLIGDTRNVMISDSIAQNIFIDAPDPNYPPLSGGGARRIILQNITTGTANCTPGIVPPTPPGTRPDIIYVNIGNYCGAQ